MNITHSAIAGTLESSDAQVLIEAHEKGVAVDVSSSVFAQYGAHIQALAEQTAADLNMNGVLITINDKGALDCTIKARIEAAYFRASDQTQGFNWEEL